MLGVWLLICAIVPAILTLVIERTIPIPDGGEIVLTQREAVNDAWDLPREATYQPFLEHHPEWSNDTNWDSKNGFEWKWYYAFQQVGDQTVEPLSQSYRDGQSKRDELANSLSLISPATLMQRIMERLADTDMSSAIAYDQSVRDFHSRLRAWYYPNLFRHKDFNPQYALETIPVFEPLK